MSGAFKKPVKVGVWRGGNPPNGYEWTVLILDLAHREAMEHLTPSQYEHLAGLVRDLATHANPTVSDRLDLDRVETFLELREKGSGLGPKVNVRVYYDKVDTQRVIRILGFDWKKNEGSILLPVKQRILRRQRMWNEGFYPLAQILEQKPDPAAALGKKEVQQ